MRNPLFIKRPKSGDEMAPPKGASSVDVVDGDPTSADLEADGDETDPGSPAGGDADGSAVTGEAAVTDETTRGPRLRRAITFVVLPFIALGLGAGAGYLKWQTASSSDIERARSDSMQAAKDTTVALLSYRPGTVEKDLAVASDKLTGQFRDSYATLTKDVVIPGAQQRQITAVATVPAAASISATRNHAIVLVYVNQTTTVGTGQPTDTASAVRVNLDEVGGRWLIAGFDPI